MCDLPEHAILHRIEKKLEKVDADVDAVAEVQSSLYDAVFGAGTTKGLVTKVDDINSGNKRESVVVSTITSVLVAVLSIFGWNFGSNS